MKMKTALLAGVLVTAPAAPVLADQALRGLVNNSTGSIVLITDLILDDEATSGIMKFSAPASCSARIKLESQEGSKRTYVFADDLRGRFCQRLSGGKMISSVSGYDTYILINSGPGNQDWTGKLGPQQ